MQDLVLFGAGVRVHPIGWNVPREVTPAVGPHGAGEAALREEGQVLEQGWGATRPPQGGTEAGATSGVAGDREPVPSPPVAAHSSGSAAGLGCLSRRIWGTRFPQFSSGQPALGAAPRPGHSAPGRDVLCPPPKCHRGVLSIWDQGNGTKQGLNPKQSHPPAQGAAAIPKPSPGTQPLCHGSEVTPGCPHSGDPPVPLPWAQAGLSSDKSQPQAAHQGQPWHGQDDVHTLVTGCVPVPEQSRCQSPTPPIAPAPQGPPPAPKAPPSTLSKHPSAQQDEPRGDCSRSRCI